MVAYRKIVINNTPMRLCILWCNKIFSFTGEVVPYRCVTREELINGRILSMSLHSTFNHNQIASNIFLSFSGPFAGAYAPHCWRHPPHLTEKNRFVPDMMMICDRDKIQSAGVHGAPDLVVEVLSPNTVKRNRAYKKDTYEKCGVRQY